MLFGLKKQMKNTGELNIFPYVLLNVQCEIAYWYNGIFFLFLFSSSSLFIYLFIFKSLRDFSKATKLTALDIEAFVQSNKFTPFIKGLSRFLIFEQTLFFLSHTAGDLHPL